MSLPAHPYHQAQVFHFCGLCEMFASAYPARCPAAFEPQKFEARAAPETELRFNCSLARGQESEFNLVEALAVYTLASCNYVYCMPQISITSCDAAVNCRLRATAVYVYEPHIKNSD